jgi:hypothetical protein
MFCPGSASNDMNTVLQNWKERMDFTKKLLTLLNSYTPPEIRSSAIGKAHPPVTQTYKEIYLCLEIV